MNNQTNCENIEIKRRKNLEDNRRFLAALKINDIRNEIKEISNNEKDSIISTNVRRNAKKELPADVIRRSSRIRKHYEQNENLVFNEEKRKKKNHIHIVPKVKLQLPEHMLLRYQSTGKKVALHNSKAKFGDNENEIF